MFLYILKSVEYSKTYVGITDNLERRLSEHNTGQSTYTSKYTPWKIIYTESCDSMSEAHTREKYFKSAAGRKRIKEIHSGIAQR